MSTYNDVAITVAPADAPLEDVAAQCRDLVEAPLDELPGGRWEDNRERFGDRDFDRGELSVEVDRANGQVYLYGRTYRYACHAAWREWVRAAEVGDGHLAVVLNHEVDHLGAASVYEHRGAVGYRTAVDSPDHEEFHVDGEPLGFGAIAAYRIHGATGVRPARYAGSSLRRWDGDCYLPETYYDRVDDPAVPEEAFRAALDDGT